MAARITEPFSAVAIAEAIAIPAIVTPCIIERVALPVSPSASPSTSQLSIALLMKSKVPEVASARSDHSVFICFDVFLDPSCCFLNTADRAFPIALNGFVSNIFCFAASS